MKKYIILLNGDRFLGYGYGIVSEYPDAMLFDSQKEAHDAVRRFKTLGKLLVEDGVNRYKPRVVSTEDYQAGNV